jgi:hypothetical protein
MEEARVGPAEGSPPASGQVSVTLMSPEYFASPYRIYERLRAAHPVYWSDEVDRWLLLRYEDVARALRAREFTTQFPRPGLFRDWFTYKEGDDHARLRKVVNPHFSTASARLVRDRIGAVADQLIEEARQKREIDFMEEFATPLPVNVITSILGLPPQDGPLLVKWTTEITAAKGLATSPEMKFKSVESFHAMIHYLRGFVADFPEADFDAHPTADLIRAFRRGMISDGELPATLMLLILAAIETTSSLISNGLLALLKNPDQRDKLVEDPSLLKNAVEEMLRYDAPAQFINRIARDDVEVGGVRVRAGQNILAVIGSANRDPEVFPEPDAFDIERPNAIRHLAFGGGAHHCAGAPLAREAAAVVFERLLPHLPRIELAGSAESWQTITLMFRRLESLRVKLR